MYMRYNFLRFPQGKAKALTLSYDDGFKYDVKLAQILTKYNIKGTFNLNGENFRGEKCITKEEVEEYILSKGHEVAVHGYFHKSPARVRAIEGLRDVLDSRLELEKTYNRIIRGMAYPDTGNTEFIEKTSYETVRNYLSSLDIAYARTINGDNNSFSLPHDWYQWVPTAHHNNPKVMEYVDEFLALSPNKSTYVPIRHPRLFYLWGHSYEFNDNNNWDLIEEICAKFSKQANEIWFATNIEIYNYVEAYNSLVYSADTSIIHNPSLHDVWLDIDGTTYCIPSGQILQL